MSIQSIYPSLTTRRSALSPAFRLKLAEMALPLSPLVQVTTGAIHPSFPRLLVNYWLLTESDLDELAAFYHQRNGGGSNDDSWKWKTEYPLPIRWDDNDGIETKRRRFGRFIGLRGCESPGPGVEAWSRVEIPDDEVLKKMRWYY